MNIPKIPIIFENKDFIAVEKPIGLSVHNNEDEQNLLSVLEGELGVKKLFPVHRLDKETSGVQLFALNKESAKKLSIEFQGKAVKKIYIGVLRGQLKDSEGVWLKEVSDKAEGRKNPAGFSKDRMVSITVFKVLESTKYFSLCEFDLQTGRQHQIRKHSALANHSLVGDTRYGDKKYNQKISQNYETDRMFLHCKSISILGITIDSPVPQEFNEMISKSLV